MLAVLLGHSMFMSSSESGPAFSTLQVLAALPSHSVFSKSEFSLFCLWSRFRFPCIVDLPLSHRFGLCIPRLDYCSGYRTTPLLKPSGYFSSIEDPRMP